MRTFLQKIQYDRKKLVSHTPEGVLWEIEIHGWKDEMDSNWGVKKCGFNAYGSENFSAAYNGTMDRQTRWIHNVSKRLRKNTDETCEELKTSCSLSSIAVSPDSQKYV